MVDQRDENCEIIRQILIIKNAEVHTLAFSISRNHIFVFCDASVHYPKTDKT